MPSRIPDLPGTQIHPDIETELRRHVASLCGLENTRFPGSQPVSFGAGSLERLEKEDYWVCEKSDGVRVLVLIAINPSDHGQEVYLIDRHNRYREIVGIYFPHYEDPSVPLTDTLLDAELVLDYDPHTHKETLRLLVFDCIVGDRQNLISKPLVKRYGRLREWVLKPLDRMLREFPNLRNEHPFEVLVKQMQPSYHVAKVIEEFKTLQHGHDGLIFTCAESAYLPGADSRLLKWKPPSENSVDLKLELRFPPLASNASRADMRAKPAFALSVWTGGEGYAFFDLLDVGDREWDEMKKKREQWDDRVVEVCWDAPRQAWRVMRFRDDKPHANHSTVVDSVLESIRDGVELSTLLAHAQKIRNEWRARDERKQVEARRQAAAAPPARLPGPGEYPAPGSQFTLIGRLYGPPTVDGFTR